jgi:hypothetical protein
MLRGLQIFDAVAHVMMSSGDWAEDIADRTLCKKLDESGLFDRVR